MRRPLRWRRVSRNRSRRSRLRCLLMRTPEQRLSAPGSGFGQLVLTLALGVGSRRWRWPLDARLTALVARLWLSPLALALGPGRSGSVRTAESPRRFLPGAENGLCPTSPMYTLPDRMGRPGTFSVGLIYGPSGCGKSSLVKAGLLPRLSEDVIPVYVEATASPARRLTRSAASSAAGSRAGKDQ